MKKDEFLKCPTSEIRLLVQTNAYPHTGIFISDGNRRLVMTETKLKPDSRDFYESYIKIVTGYFQKNLEVFFDFGLNTLLFPLFGPSLLKRGDLYREHVMPELIRLLFVSSEWQDFYKRYGIRLKVYGTPEPLESDLGRPDLLEMIRDGENKTAHYREHTLFFGFFSEGISERGFMNCLTGFIRENDRSPKDKELVELYYGETVKPVDFLINSTRLAGLGALPPWLYGRKARMYTLVVPAVLGLTEKTYRDVLYDLLFQRKKDANGHIDAYDPKRTEAIAEYYRENRNRVLGLGKVIKNNWVLDI